ncbi:hypothetical protein LZD49_18440 [Dyadobacter sp. CY261]|uniref:hypothetical protein n=1 Tax=Dyadobacter sp. CY261 TaxID=2907203 RepID=UPI001F38652B|nr:hypothetical protein [Dyadobacter sp. CY261]MCF0072467.1 hypothetical protein [Dyadobacter sp. CY261]
MVELPEYFSIQFEGTEVDIRQRSINGRRVFQVSFNDNLSDLFIHRATVANGKRMWMSIPEGRQEQAMLIGQEIVKFYRNFRQQQNEQ